MFLFPKFRRQASRPSTDRPQTRRTLSVEGLEGRQLLSSVAGPGYTVRFFDLAAVPSIVGNHIGTSVATIKGSHVGSVAAGAIQGNHIGTSAV
jgi:hypothetical protein